MTFKSRLKRLFADLKSDLEEVEELEVNHNGLRRMKELRAGVALHPKRLVFGMARTIDTMAQLPGKRWGP